MLGEGTVMQCRQLQAQSLQLGVIVTQLGAVQPAGQFDPCQPVHTESTIDNVHHVRQY